MAEKWIVHTKGGPDCPSFEIAVIRSNNRLGQDSYGWFGPTKLLISHNGGPCSWPVTPMVWEALVHAAESVAQQLNDTEAPNG